MFDQSPLPFQLDYGQVGRIYLKIPFWDMFKSPLVIEIEDVFGYVSIKEMAKWDETQVREAFKQSTQATLEQFEVFLKQKALISETEKESKKDD